MAAYISLKLVYGLFFANRFLTIRTTGFAWSSFDASFSGTGTLLAVRRSARYKARAAVRCRELRAAMNVERDMGRARRCLLYVYSHLLYWRVFSQKVSW
jgi:hypothetical protein